MKTQTAKEPVENTVYALIKTSADVKKERALCDAEINLKLSPLKKRFDRFVRHPMKGREYLLELVSFGVVPAEGSKIVKKSNIGNIFSYRDKFHKLAEKRIEHSGHIDLKQLA